MTITEAIRKAVEKQAEALNIADRSLEYFEGYLHGLLSILEFDESEDKELVRKNLQAAIKNLQ